MILVLPVVALGFLALGVRLGRRLYSTPAAQPVFLPDPLELTPAELDRFRTDWDAAVARAQRSRPGAREYTDAVRSVRAVMADVALEQQRRHHRAPMSFTLAPGKCGAAVRTSLGAAPCLKPADHPEPCQ